MTTEIPESGSGDANICADHVRNHDPDRYLCAMFAPVSVRPALMALYAFNIELSMVRERVNEPLLGEMRFQWWRDQIDGCYGGTPRPEGIAGELYSFIKKFDPPRQFFDDLINTRTRDLVEEPFGDLSDFEEYCRGTAAPLVQLSLIPLSTRLRHEIIPAPLARNIGVASAATGLIRAIPMHAAQGRCVVPASMMQRQRATRETVFLDQSRSVLQRIAQDLASCAKSHLKSAKAQTHDVADDLFPGFLPLVMAEFYLEGLEKSGYDPFHARVQHPNRAVRILRLMFAAWRKRC